jgi:putative modified peptide
MSYQLPEPIIDRLLDRLGNDDAFRAAFVTDTRAALASIGFEPAGDASITRGLWECFAVTQIATKAEIRRAHLQLRRQLSMEAVFFPFTIGVREMPAKCAA